MNAREHSADHEKLIRDVVIGELDPDAPDVRAAAETCDVCHERLDAFSRVADRLDAAGRLEAEILREADRREDAPGLEAVRRALGEVARPRRSWRGLAVGIAAAAVLAVVAAIFAFDGPFFSDDPGPDVFVGAGLTPLHPVSGPTDFAEFRWADDSGRRAGDVYVVDVFIRGDRGTRVARSGELDEPRWIPAGGIAWPDAIEWVVTKYREGVPLAHGSSSAFSRSE